MTKSSEEHKPTECQLCDVRRKEIAKGTWNVGFRWCPHCAAPWR